MSHSLGSHFGCFVPGNIAFPLEIRAIDTLDNAGISQFDDRLISPTISRYIDKGIGGKGAGCAQC